MDYSPRWVYTRSRDRCASTTTVADKHMGKVVGKPYRGKPDVRFDEGTGGKAVTGNWEPAAHTERGRDGNPPPKTARTKVLLYSLLRLINITSPCSIHL